MENLLMITKNKTEWRNTFIEYYKNELHLIGGCNFKAEDINLSKEEDILISKVLDFLESNNPNLYKMEEIKFLRKNLAGMSYKADHIYKKYERFVKRLIE